MTGPLQVLALCLIDGVRGTQWQVVARQATQPGGLDDLLAGRVTESHRAAKDLERNLATGLERLDEITQAAEEHVDNAARVGAKLISVLDDAYPSMLQRVRERPPFLFYIGDLSLASQPSVAVVGTRKPSSEGIARTSRLAAALAQAEYVVVSGMAAGVDTAAHRSALAHHGATTAVMGTGILRTYPATNQGLRSDIAESGLLVSQFLPDQPPGRHTFPMRNVVTSGLAHATVVVEASDTSGARLQARIAAEQGRAVLLLSSLVEKQVWANEMVAGGRARQVASAHDVLEAVSASIAEEKPAESIQLRLDAQ